MSKKIINHRYTQNINDKSISFEQIEIRSQLKMKVTKTKHRRHHKNKSTDNYIDAFVNVEHIGKLRDKFKNYVKTETENKINNLKEEFRQLHNQKADEIQNQILTVATLTSNKTDALIETYFKQKESFENWKVAASDAQKVNMEAMDKFKDLITNFSK